MASHHGHGFATFTVPRFGRGSWSLSSVCPVVCWPPWCRYNSCCESRAAAKRAKQKRGGCCDELRVSKVVQGWKLTEVGMVGLVGIIMLETP